MATQTDRIDLQADALKFLHTTLCGDYQISDELHQAIVKTQVESARLILESGAKTLEVVRYMAPDAVFFEGRMDGIVAAFNKGYESFESIIPDVFDVRTENRYEVEPPATAPEIAGQFNNYHENGSIGTTDIKGRRRNRLAKEEYPLNIMLERLYRRDLEDGEALPVVWAKLLENAGLALAMLRERKAAMAYDKPPKALQGFSIPDVPEHHILVVPPVLASTGGLVWDSLRNDAENWHIVDTRQKPIAFFNGEPDLSYAPEHSNAVMHCITLYSRFDFEPAYRA